ncbi:MAG: hypothetical protein ACF8XB_04610, partial [Planctomycetota bacterium JB042]
FQVDAALEGDVLALSGRVELRGKPLKVARARPEGGARSGGPGPRWNRRPPAGPPRGRGRSRSGPPR